MGDQLNPAEQGELLRVARTTMEEHLANHRTPVIETASSRLMQRAGASEHESTIRGDGQFRVAQVFVAGLQQGRRFPGHAVG